MSHVWGQTLPSNYGRLSAESQRVFHTNPLDDIAQEAMEKTFKELSEEVQEKIGKAAFEKVQKEVAEEVGEEVSEEIMEKAMKETLEEVGEDASAEVMETALKKNLKNMAEEAIETTTTKVTRKAAKEAVEEIPESTVERLGKTAIKTGGAVVGGVLIFNSFINSDAVDNWVAARTGMDCDDRAKEAGLVEGTPEYEERVTECQEKAAESLAFMGKAFTYGGLAIGALIAVSILGKLGIFSGSSGDDEE